MCLAAPRALPATPAAERVLFAGSVREVPLGAPASGPRRVREVLTAAESAEPLEFVVSLRMRNFAELASRIGTGQLISRAEMEEKYLPDARDYARVGAWLASQGMELTLADANHTNLFARGPVSRVAGALGVAFARVATADGEFTSAVTDPSLPADVADAVLGIVGLQPHQLMHTPRLVPDAVTTVAGRTTPADIAAAYNIPGSLDGTGQTIAVIIDSVPQASDLTAFWTAIGSTETTANFSSVNVSGGPAADRQTADINEATLDVEWASGLAPGAQVRVYATSALNQTNAVAACTQIMNEGLAKVVNYSASAPEGNSSQSFRDTTSQTYAQMAAAGITFLTSSGDSGSNPNTDMTNGYNPANALDVQYPASDPFATGVGGTTVAFNTSWVKTGETVWSQIGNVATNPLASGGGVSTYFPRPAWQTGAGLPAGTARCVPDVSAMASAMPAAAGTYTGGFAVINGQQVGLIGTSLSSPIMAAIAAVIDQKRATLGLTPLGLFGHWLYAMSGMNGVNDVQSGTNGAYSAGPGYDMCTGVGTLNVTSAIALIDAAVVSYTYAPAGPVPAGTPVTMSASAQVTPATYQWQLGSTNIAGATGSTYQIAAAGAADNGTYHLLISNSLGNYTFNMGTLTTTSDARIMNLSARADVQSGANALIAGFAVAGSAQKSVLIRGVGPGLAQFSVPGILAAPVLTLFNSSSVQIASNAAWGGGSDLKGAMSGVGAFSLAANSLDTALLQSFQPGTYTANVSGAGGSNGVALAEIYDADTGAPPSRIVNISARANIQAGANALIAGFVIAPGPTNSSEAVLVRGVGPALAGFGVAGALASPTLTLFDSQGAAIATNQGWSTKSSAGSSTVKAGVEISTTATMGSVGAFGLTAGSADCAMTVTLPPGSYTAQVTGANSTTGVGLVEVYEVR